MDRASSPTKWALCIGIDHYPMFKGRDLRGCANDARQIAGLLTERFGFPARQIRTLLNEQATKEAILGSLDDLVQQAGKDDVVVVHYSGHGSQMTDREGDEEDGMDETILPCDTGRDPHPNRDITDDEIYAWLLKITEATPYVTLIFDCCHSGTIVRDGPDAELEPVGVRWVEPDERPIEELPPSPFEDGFPWPRDIGPSGWLPVGERFTLLAGCSSRERSYEIQFRGQENLGSNGAFTHYLLDALRNAPKDVTYRDVFESVAPKVTAYRKEQHPQLEGARDRELFGSRRLEPMRFVPVAARERNRIQLSAGAAQGVVEGAIWAIYPPGTKTLEGGEILGRVQILRVGVSSSESRLLEEGKPEAIQAGARAVLESQLPAGLLRSVAVQAPPGHEAEVRRMEQGIEGSRHLLPSGNGKVPEVIIQLLVPRGPDLRRDGLPDIGGIGGSGGSGEIQEPVWAVTGADGQLWMRPYRVSELDAIERVVRNLEKMVRCRYVLGLGNPGSALEGTVELTFLRRYGGDWISAKPGSSGEVVFREREPLALEITNRSERPLYVHVLDLGMTGGISLVYPGYDGAQKALDPGRSIRVGTRLGDEIDPYLPDGVPFDLREGASIVRGKETLKVFATTHEADFMPLFQNGMRDVGRAPAGLEEGSLEHQIAFAVSDPLAMPRDFRERERGPAPDWTAFERDLIVERWN